MHGFDEAEIVARAWNSHDFGDCRALLSDSSMYRSPAVGDGIVGAEAIVEYFQATVDRFQSGGAGKRLFAQVGHVEDESRRACVLFAFGRPDAVESVMDLEVQNGGSRR